MLQFILYTKVGLTLLMTDLVMSQHIVTSLKEKIIIVF